MISRKPVLYNGDDHWYYVAYSGASAGPDRKYLEGIVDNLAEAKVGIYSQVFYDAGLSRYETKVGEMFYENYSLWGMSPDGKRFVGQRADGTECGGGTYPYRSITDHKRLVAEGNEPIKVFTERCHQRDMKFLACLRMNDRHGVSVDNPCRFLKEHPELTMQPWGAMDYRHPEVQDYIAAHIEELAGNYDVDGIELDWMRWVKVFSEGVPADERRSILNDFHRRIRTLLDEIGRKKYRELLLSVRVPGSLAECEPHGYDVATCCRESLVDIVCPSDFLFNDPHLAVGEFSRLTRDTGILLMPSLHHQAGWLAGPSSTENLRALAHSYYAQGADGISAYNWFGARLCNMPENFQALQEAADQEALDRLPRAYLFNPIWGEYSREDGQGENVLRRSPTDRVFPYFARVSRARPGKREVFPILIEEDLGKVHAKLRLKVEGLTEEDEVVIDVNGKPLDLNRCAKLFDSVGKPENTQLLGPEWVSRAYHQFMYDNAQGLLRNGSNEIALTLTKANPDIDGDITLFEIWVEVDTGPF